MINKCVFETISLKLVCNRFCFRPDRESSLRVDPECGKLTEDISCQRLGLGPMSIMGAAQIV